MSEQQLKFLKELAEKLGTTVEYLWSALLVQAKLNAYHNIFMCLTVSALALGWHIHFKNWLKVTDKAGSYGRSEYREAKTDKVAIDYILFANCILFWFLSISSILSGFFNPEYWALTELLDLLK
jgi:hypothetical protein